MEELIPRQMREDAVIESNIYFFENNCPVGIPGHMHVCIKRKNKIVIFAACSSKTGTAKRLAEKNNWSPLTFPVFEPNEETNMFDDTTYVDCNHPIVLDLSGFVDYMEQGYIKLLKGNLTADDMKDIKYGIQASSLVVRKTKKLFDK